MFSLFRSVVVLTFAPWSTLSMKEPSEYVLDFPTQNNPLNITVDSRLDRNYFMIIGDWGAESDSDREVQQAVAQKMINLYETRKEEGYNLLFVATVGDNFYYSGQTCEYYTERWTDIYGDLAKKFPWLAVFGNHDWGDNDPNAICAWGASDPNYVDPRTNIPYAANQINSDKGGCNPSLYYLPDFGYYYRIDELSFELIFLEETASICPDDMGGQSYKSCNNSYKVGCEYLGKMQNASEAMLMERAQSSSNSNFLIAQHYPEQSDRLLSMFKSARASSKNYTNNDDNRDSLAGKAADEDTVWSAYGHDHRQECQRYESGDDAACESLLSGGGSGCCQEDTLRGFFVIGFDEDGRMTQPYKYDDDEISCHYPCKEDGGLNGVSNGGLTKQQMEQSQFEHCCYAYTFRGKRAELEKEKCAGFDLRKC